uniref:ShKT domain-containing protein n=1 Tax=Strongyloides venezuelensis TaxID=75913 RepID=A0A0K0G2A6_STRVS
MYSFTSYCIILIDFLGLNFIECDDTKACANAGECTVANTKCLKDVKRDFDGANGNFCAQLCDAAKVDEQCGTGETCVNVKDIDNADVLSCVKTAQCFTDEFCEIFNPQSTSASGAISTTTSKATSTTTSITTTTATTRKIVTTAKIVDKISGGGLYGCEVHLKYYTDPIWLDFTKPKCPKTCGYTAAISIGNNGTEGCRDVFSDCAQNAKICKYLLYKKFMREICAKTCGYC